MDKQDERLSDVRISQAEGEISSDEDMADWMLSVLSGGNIGAYVFDVLKRAQERPGETAV